MCDDMLSSLDMDEVVYVQEHLRRFEKSWYVVTSYLDTIVCTYLVIVSCSYNATRFAQPSASPKPQKRVSRLERFPNRLLALSLDSNNYPRAVHQYFKCLEADHIHRSKS